jgi:hypothetical protein
MLCLEMIETHTLYLAIFSLTPICLFYLSSQKLVGMLTLTSTSRVTRMFTFMVIIIIIFIIT